MTTPIHILGFAGSLRKASINAGLLRTAAEVLPEGMTLEIFDLTPIPFYNGDVEAAGLPEAVKQFKDRIVAADALLIATPEYNGSIPGLLKNALDWASRPMQSSVLSGKPLAMMGAGGASGTKPAQFDLHKLATATNMLSLNRPTVYIAAHQKFDAEGNLTDEAARKSISGLLVALAVWTRRLRGEK